MNNNGTDQTSYVVVLKVTLTKFLVYTLYYLSIVNSAVREYLINSINDPVFFFFVLVVVAQVYLDQVA